MHWPKGIPETQNGKILSQNGYLPDIVETCLDVAKAQRPETRNGKGVPSGYMEKTKELKDKLDRWHEKVGAQIMQPNPDYDSSVKSHEFYEY